MSPHRRRPREPSRAARIVLLAMLAVCVLQAAYWIVEIANHATAVRDREAGSLERDARAASAMLERGARLGVVRTLFPRVDLAGGGARIDAELLAELDRERDERIRRTLWEGAFFLVVLVVGMGILSRTLVQESELRRRQQNFLAAVTHELKSPVASIRLSAETMARTAPDAGRRAELAARVVEDAQRLEETIGHVLDAARLEEGRLGLAPVRIELAEVVERAERSLASRAREVRAELVAEVEGGIELSADPGALESVVRNLLDNAVQAVGARGGGRVELRARAADGEVEIEVRDDGVGFPPEEAALLFEKFYRPGDELRRRSRGTGLGLWLVDRMVALHGGTVTGESAGAGRGATFRVRWPIAGGAGDGRA